ncbi:MAG: AAA family ATPase [Pseudomonadota bacterium]|nr:AAA family ATPase [Pseudomonadota bacterium]
MANSPGSVRGGLKRAVTRLRDVAEEPIRRVHRDHTAAQDAALKAKLERMKTTEDWLREPAPRSAAPFYWPAPIHRHWLSPAELVVFDEADRLRASSLEEVRDIFDQSGVPVVLIGMPGLEKRLARHAQLYSRIGFVHRYRPLGAEELRRLLDERWTTLAPGLPSGTSEEALSALVRMTAGNLRLVTRLLDQIRRILVLNGLPRIDRGVVEAARESLVNGAA